MDEARVAIVAEASTGAGAAIALRLAREAYIVIVHFQSNADAALAVVDAIEDFGGMAQAVQADLADAASVRAMFDLVEAELEGVDVFVGNTDLRECCALADTDDAGFERLVARQLRCAFHCMREAARRLHPDGRIVQVSSIRAAASGAQSGICAATNAGADALARALSCELRDRGICVNSVAVSWHDPPQGAFEDLATLVAFLSGPASASISGQRIGVEG